MIIALMIWLHADSCYLLDSNQALIINMQPHHVSYCRVWAIFRCWGAMIC